jgi:hypothetical protein
MNDVILIPSYYDSIPDVMSLLYAIKIPIDTPRIHPQNRSYNVVPERSVIGSFHFSGHPQSDVSKTDI